MTLKRTPMKRKQPRRDAEPGYCQCGCGAFIGFWEGTDRRLGRVKGEPKRYKIGHQSRHNFTLTAESYREDWERERPEIPYGYCWCGCGQPTKPSKYNSMGAGTVGGIVKGEPRRYVAGHTDRLQLRGFELVEVGGQTYAKIPLTRGYAAIVDKSDAEWLSQWNWYYCDGYARRSEHKQTSEGERVFPVLMHRALLDVPDGFDVDHANRDGLDNRRSNIRVASRAENQANAGKSVGVFTSNYKGVHWHARRRRWAATIGVDGTRLHLGYFDSEVEAALSYDEAAVEHHGEFARLNFPHVTDAVKAAGGIALANRRLSGNV